MKFNQFKTQPSPESPQVPLLALPADENTEAEIEIYMLKNGWCPICSYPVIEDTAKHNIHIYTYTCKMNLLHIFEVDHASGTVTSLTN